MEQARGAHAGQAGADDYDVRIFDHRRPFGFNDKLNCQNCI
jgi:hypothetical protein